MLSATASVRMMTGATPVAGVRTSPYHPESPRVSEEATITTSVASVPLMEPTNSAMVTIMTPNIIGMRVTMPRSVASVNPRSSMMPPVR